MLPCKSDLNTSLIHAKIRYKEWLHQCTVKTGGSIWPWLLNAKEIWLAVVWFSLSPPNLSPPVDCPVRDDIIVLLQPLSRQCTMTGIPSLVIATLLLCTHDGSASRRQKRIVGGEKANPPPANATDAEDVVENPALISAVVTTTTTTKRPTTKRSVELDDGPIVFMRRGRREARVSGIKNPTGYYSFHGLRYAQPPLGPLRYQVLTSICRQVNNCGKVYY